MSRDHLAADLALARGQTVRHKQQAEQLIATCRLDGDRNLVFVATDAAGWPRRRAHWPARPEPAPGNRRVRPHRAPTAMTCIITMNRPGAISSSRSSPFLAPPGSPPEVRRCGPTTTMAGWSPGIELPASERTASLVASAMAGATAARKSVSRSLKSLPGAHHAGRAPARPVGQEQDAKLLVNPQRPPDVVEPDAPVAVMIRQVRQLGGGCLAKRQGSEAYAARPRCTRPRPAAARTPLGCASRRWSWC